MAEEDQSEPSEEQTESRRNQESNGTWAVGNNAAQDHWFKPGESGNPGGKHKGPSFMTALYRELQRIPKDQERTKTELLVLQIVNTALKGKSDQQKMVLDRVAPANIDLRLSGSDDRPPIVIVHRKTSDEIRHEQDDNFERMENG